MFVIPFSRFYSVVIGLGAFHLSMAKSFNYRSSLASYLELVILYKRLEL